MTMPDEFAYDVFLSHSSRDKAVARPLAEQSWADGLEVWFDEWVHKQDDSIPAKIGEGLEHSRVLVLCMSANAFGLDWAQLESGTFRFRDPLNRERRFIPLRLDDARIPGSLAQLRHINWIPADREQEYGKMVWTGCIRTKPAQAIFLEPSELNRIIGKFKPFVHVSGAVRKGVLDIGLKMKMHQVANVQMPSAPLASRTRDD